MIIKITGGELRGRTYNVGDSPDTRPTMQKVREALFSIIKSYGLDGPINVLDLYSGTGAIGIEALSRGASRVQFVEKNKKVSHELSRNLEVLDLESISEVYIGRVDKFLSNKNIFSPYDLIISDPPYSDKNLLAVLKLAIDNNYFGKDSLFIYECDKELTEKIEGIEILKSKKYGDTFIHCLRLSN